MPKGSVILPCFNGEKFLRKTLDSLLSQTCDDFEVILIDDGSVDATPEIIAEYARAFPNLFKTLFSERNLGVCESVRRGIQCAKGQYILTLAQDDYWDSNYVQEMLSTLEASATASAVFSQVVMIDDEGSVIDRRLFRNGRIQEVDRFDLLAELINGNFLCATSAAFRNLPEVETFLGTNNEQLQDYELWLNLLLEGDFVYTGTTNSYYRSHDQNLSGAKKSDRQEDYDMYATLSRLLLSERFDEFIGKVAPDHRSLWLAKVTQNLASHSAFSSSILGLVSVWLERVSMRGDVDSAVLRSLRMEIAIAQGLFRKSLHIANSGKFSRTPLRFERPALAVHGPIPEPYQDFLKNLFFIDLFDQAPADKWSQRFLISAAESKAAYDYQTTDPERWPDLQISYQTAAGDRSSQTLTFGPPGDHWGPDHTRQIASFVESSVGERTTFLTDRHKRTIAKAELKKIVSKFIPNGLLTVLKIVTKRWRQ